MKIFSKCNALLRHQSHRRAPKIGALGLGIVALCFAVGCQSGGYSEITTGENTAPQRGTTPRPIKQTTYDTAPAANENEAALEGGVCRPGSTFRTITGEAAQPQACREICRNLMDCMAFTFMSSPTETTHCELKHSVPEAMTGPESDPKGCVSWVNPRASARIAQLEAQRFELRSQRPGENLREFAMDQADPALCQKACDNLRDCQAFTYTRPGYDGEQARCALKTEVQAPVADQDCCISGLK